MPSRPPWPIAYAHICPQECGGKYIHPSLMASHVNVQFQLMQEDLGSVPEWCFVVIKNNRFTNQVLQWVLVRVQLDCITTAHWLPGACRAWLCHCVQDGVCKCEYLYRPLGTSDILRMASVCFPLTCAYMPALHRRQ